MMEASQADVDRFMALVDKLPCGCWFWTGARSRGRGNKKWYGSFRVGGRVVRAHRFACDVLGGAGPLPPGMHRGHSCHFSLCVNPEHIAPMTREENQRQINGRRTANGQVQAQGIGEGLHGPRDGDSPDRGPDGGQRSPPPVPGG